MLGVFDDLNLERMYVLASLVMAVLVWIETTWIRNNQGKLPESSVFAIISLMTSSWLVVSGLALFFLDFDNLQMSVAVSYGVYFVASWIYGAKLISVADIDDPMDLVMPPKYLDFGRAFALVFAFLCIFVLCLPHLSIGSAFGYK